MKNLLTPLAKSALIPLRSRAWSSVADAWIHKNILVSRTYGVRKKTLITSNKEMNEIMKIVGSLKHSGLMIKCVTRTTEM